MAAPSGKRKTVENYMAPLAFTLNTEQTLEDARKFLLDNKMTSAPLVSQRGHVVAVVTDFRLLKCFIKRSQLSQDVSLLGNFLTEFEGAVTVAAHESIVEGFKKMIEAPSHRVFVMDKEEKTVGCLEPTSLFELAASKKPEPVL